MSKKEIKYSILFLAFGLIVLFAFTKKTSLGLMVFSGSIFLLLIYSIWRIRKIKNNGEEVFGNIIDYEFDNEGDATPIIEFKTLSDEKINGTPFIWSNFSLSGMRVNKKSATTEVKVVYDTNNPSKFILPEYSFINSFTLIIIILFILTMFLISAYDYFITPIY